MLFKKLGNEEKIRTGNILSFFVISSIIVLVFLLVISYRKDKIQSNKEKEIFRTQKTENNVSCRVNEHAINSGEVFAKLNTVLGLSDEELQELLQVSQDVYDLSQIKANNVIRSFFGAEDGIFQKLEYEIDKDNILTIEREKDGRLTARKKPIDYEIELDKVTGLVETTFYQAGQEAGLTDKTIMEMADIFAWDIDFGIEVKQGDEFEVLYEKKFLNGQEVRLGRILVAKYKNNGRDYWAIYYKDAENREDYYDLDGNCLRKQFLKAPVNYKYISSGYSLHRFHPVWEIYTTHQAVDYAANCGTPVSAAGDGTVILAGWKDNVYGRTVEIRHNDVYTTRYAHLSAYGKGIKYGVKVMQGQIIGYIGTSGASTGCHLDYAMKKYGSFVNPLTQNFERSEPLKEIYREDFNLYKEALLKLFNSK